MSTRGKRVAVTLALVLAVAGIVAVFGQRVLLLAVHSEVIRGAHNYQPVDIPTFNGQYTLRTRKIERPESVYASFVVLAGEPLTELYACPDLYRTMDLKSIDWVGDTLDVRVVSGDVGTYQYAFDGETWAERVAVPRQTNTPKEVSS